MSSQYDESPPSGIGHLVVLAAVGTFAGYATVSRSRFLGQEGDWLRASIPLLADVAIIVMAVVLRCRRSEDIGRGAFLLGAVWLLCCLHPYSSLTSATLAPVWRMYCLLFVSALTFVAARYAQFLLKGRENALGHSILATLLTLGGGYGLRIAIAVVDMVLHGYGRN